MSKRTDSHTISHAENIFSGSGVDGAGSGRGIPRASLVQVDLGTPSIADVNGIFAQDSGAGGPFPFNLTIDGALASGGVATFDVPRGVQIVSASGAGTSVFVFYGTDKYGVEIQESLTADGQTIVFGKKAFKTVTRVTVSADTTTSFNGGDSDILGLPFRLENVADIVVIDENNQNKFQVIDQTAANPASVTSAALTENSNDTTPDTTIADVRSPISDSSGNSAKATDINSLFVLVDSNFADLADQVNKLTVDLGLVRAEVVKLVTDAAAVDVGTIVKADATVTTTATTGDVRGTYNPTMTLDGSKTLKMTYKPKGRNTRAAYGSVQFRA